MLASPLALLQCLGGHTQYSLYMLPPHMRCPTTFAGNSIIGVLLMSHSLLKGASHEVGPNWGLAINFGGYGTSPSLHGIKAWHALAKQPPSQNVMQCACWVTH
eukprot:827015-Pelagomonas_calceolata.AAC.5